MASLEGSRQGLWDDRCQFGILKQREQRQEMRLCYRNPRWSITLGKRALEHRPVIEFLTSRQASLGDESISRAILLAAVRRDDQRQAREFHVIQLAQLAVSALISTNSKEVRNGRDATAVTLQIRLP